MQVMTDCFNSSNVASTATTIYLEVKPMADKNNGKNRENCVDACDKKFIECVESWRQDCLSRFGSCSSNCKV